MDARKAVEAAKSYFVETFNETPTLEEIWFDDLEGVWCITLGVARPVKSSVLGPAVPVENVKYKVVRLRDSDEKVLSVKIREFERAA
ncbi:MAG: hypothetical protein K0U74_08790 [Alphaproteobacteria bacterium]|nr:hypothetical protein [Alphaproteobacteria bacterium]